MSITIEIEGNESLVAQTMTLLKAIPGLRIQYEKNFCETTYMLIPNEETLESIREAESGERCNIYKNSSEMFKSLGINV